MAVDILNGSYPSFGKWVFEKFLVDYNLSQIRFSEKLDCQAA